MENGTENKNPATHGNGRARTVDTAKALFQSSS